jgi:hypothetical protein
MPVPNFRNQTATGSTRTIGTIPWQRLTRGCSKVLFGANQQWNSVGDYVASQTATATATATATGARILGSGWFGEKPRPTHAPGRSQCPDQVRWSRTFRAFLPAWTSSKVTSNPFWNERVLNNRRHLASSIEPYLSEGLAVTQRHREDDEKSPWYHSDKFSNVDIWIYCLKSTRA